MSAAQDYSQLFAGFGPYLRPSAGMRDPRSNRGPVLFPPGPAPNGADTSGVIVGASGYGFVPPNQGDFARRKTGLSDDRLQNIEASSRLRLINELAD
ncbi:hypothetical protein WN55_05475 [Dufourea novaeangliae]|uniref:Uncharacterized protein n=1 Tax=Dufourea novaeangliae TaxID=178035 RepID=A0A154PPH4_DUFNO|nr:hypothetical protein WN55_05475 [Dufourea novaeangliae]